MEAIAGGVAIGEDKGLVRVQSVLCEGVEFGGVPVNLNLDLGKGHGVRMVCTFSVSCKGNVGLVVVGIKVLQGAQVNARQSRSQKDRYLSIPTARERLLDVSSFLGANEAKMTYNLRPESTRTQESWESIMTRELNQWVETEEGFVWDEIGIVL